VILTRAARATRIRLLVCIVGDIGVSYALQIVELQDVDTEVVVVDECADKELVDYLGFKVSISVRFIDCSKLSIFIQKKLKIEPDDEFCLVLLLEWVSN